MLLNGPTVEPKVWRFAESCEHLVTGAKPVAGDGFFDSPDAGSSDSFWGWRSCPTPMCCRRQS